MSVVMTSPRLCIVRIPRGEASGAERPQPRPHRENTRREGRMEREGVCFHQIRVQLSDAAAIGAGYTRAPVINRRPVAARRVCVTHRG